MNYKNNDPNTVISTHISPEGACNLKCPYCSVTYRDTHSRIPMETIKDYVTKLKTRGLKAVILTGGGEPTAYKHFNDLVRWLYKEGLQVALISNGSKAYWKRIDEEPKWYDQRDGHTKADKKWVAKLIKDVALNDLTRLCREGMQACNRLWRDYERNTK